MISIKNIDHLNMNVSNLNRSENFYKKVFGFKTFEEGTSSKGKPYSIIGLPERIFLCLYEGLENQKEVVVNHFGVHIENFDKSIEKVKNEGLELLYGGVINYESSRSAYIADPDGNEIELTEVFGGGFH